MSAATWIQELPLFAAVREHAGAQAPRIVAGLLLALVALQLALTATRQPGREPLAAEPTLSMPAPAAKPREIDLATIVNAHLFGQKTVAPVNPDDAPQSAMPLALAGVYAVDDPKRGMAIIGQTATNARLVQVGGSVSGGVRLNSVYKDRVVIERGGALEAVYLPKSATAGRSPAPKVATAAASPGQRLQNLAQNGTLLNGLLRVQAVTAQGKLQGFRVYPGGRNSLAVFGQLGLRAGDLITHINGTALDDIDRSAEILQTLSNASSASVTVMRSGQATEVNLNFTAVAQAAEEAVAADAAAAADALAVGGGMGGGFAPGGGTLNPGANNGGSGTAGSTSGGRGGGQRQQGGFTPGGTTGSGGGQPRNGGGRTRGGNNGMSGG